MERRIKKYFIYIFILITLLLAVISCDDIGTLIIADNSEKYSEINVIIDGVSISSGGNYSFGDVAAASGPATKTFTIENSGTGDLTLKGVPFVSLSGNTEFYVQTQPSSPIPAGGSDTFIIRFDPNASGTYIGILIIENNDADEGGYSFSLTGNGT